MGTVAGCSPRVAELSPDEPHGPPAPGVQGLVPVRTGPPPGLNTRTRPLAGKAGVAAPWCFPSVPPF